MVIKKKITYSSKQIGFWKARLNKYLILLVYYESDDAGSAVDMVMHYFSIAFDVASHSAAYITVD